MVWQPRERVTFYSRAPDQFDEPAGPFAPAFDRAAQIVFLRGGETVLGQRLQSKRTAVITVQADPETLTITSAWRCVNAESGDRFDIVEAGRTEKRDKVTLLATTGGADGGEPTEADH